jgi:hypothetical protein
VLVRPVAVEAVGSSTTPPSQNTRRRRDGLAGALFWTACSPGGLIAGEHYIRRGLCFRLTGAALRRPVRQPLADSVAADDPQLRPVLLCLQNRRLPLPRQILKSVCVE